MGPQRVTCPTMPASTLPMIAASAVRSRLIRIDNACSQSASAAKVTKRPSLARWIGSKPRSSQAARTPPHRDCRLVKLDRDTRRLGDLDHGAGKAAAREIAQAANGDVGASKRSMTDAMSGAQSLSMALSKPMLSLAARTATPCRPRSPLTIISVGVMQTAQPGPWISVIASGKSWSRP